MANRLVKLARVEYTAAVLAEPPQPAYCVTRTERTVTSSGGGSSNLTIYNPGPNTWGGAPVWVYSYSGSSSTQYGTRRVTTCFPATPGVEGVPATSTEYLDIGWEAGACSVGTYRGDFALSFVLGAGSVGAICGLAPAGFDKASYNAIQFGVRLMDGVVAVVENGRVVATVGPHMAMDVVTIYRLGDRIIYEIGAWRLESTQRSTRDHLGVYANLYVSGDYVDDPTVSSIQGIGSYGEWGWPGFDTDYALRSTGEWGWSGSATLGDGVGQLVLPAMMLSGGEDSSYGTANLILPSLRVSANDDPHIEAAGLTMQIPLLFSGGGVTVGAAEADLQTAPLTMRA